tara:strand:- start:21 stop:275 length:255 start_codon:yes stop_codon:yes gene_type:complete
MSTYNPMDTEAQALTGHIKIYLEHSGEWTDEVCDKHRTEIKQEFDRLNSIPVTEFSPSAWDKMAAAIDQMFCYPSAVLRRDING